MVTPQTFRAQFEEFANPQVYSDVAINAWVTVAGMLLDPNRWDVMLDYGTSLYVAHRLVLAKRAAMAAATGAVPGSVVGPINSKAIDKVSASYDVNSLQFEDAGTYNSTTYGIDLWQLMLQFGAGPLQQTAPAGDPMMADAGGFWFGIW